MVPPQKETADCSCCCRNAAGIYEAVLAGGDAKVGHYAMLRKLDRAEEPLSIGFAIRPWAARPRGSWQAPLHHDAAFLLRSAKLRPAVIP